MQDNPLTHDEYSMAICAIRYCIGRRSYVVSEGAEWARRYGKRCPKLRAVVMRDIRSALNRHEAGGAMDEREWRAVLADLEAMGND